MTKGRLQPAIDRLRHDRLILAIQSCAINLSCIFLVLLANLYFADPLRGIVIALLLFTGPASTLYMLVVNFFRSKKLSALEQLL